MPGSSGKVEPSMAWYEAVDSSPQRLILVLCFLRTKCVNVQLNIVYRELGSHDVRKSLHNNDIS